MSQGPRYFPALDGLRALCVLAVLFFHAGFDWMRGGFLGVSTFFTLSGYLILSLLLTAHESSNTIRIRDFWARRLRRLLPAASLAVALVALSSPWWLDLSQRERLLHDVQWTLAYAVN